ncbi:hypothetical protein GPN2_22755 [Streptomyces murinus]
MTESRSTGSGRPFGPWQIVSRVALGSMGHALWGQLRRLTSTKGCLSLRQGCRRQGRKPLS